MIPIRSKVLQVVVIGYGTIGQIKARLWKELGAAVYVHDVVVSAQRKAARDGYRPVTACFVDQAVIIDVSTPAGQHYASLSWCLGVIRAPIHRILIEKPLASSAEELRAFRMLPGMHTAKIVVNESYLSSTGLHRLIDTMTGVPTHVDIELSKNRLADGARGRFFDQELGVFGIEVPHMLAMVGQLGVSLDDIRVMKATIFVAGAQHDNQGLELALQSGRTSVRLRSFLGDFTVTDGIIRHTSAMTRTMSVRTASETACITFDPAPGLPRYHSRFSTKAHGASSGMTIDLHDDHLRRHLAACLADAPLNPLLGFDTAAAVSEMLIAFRDTSVVQDISSVQVPPMPVHEEPLSHKKGMPEWLLKSTETSYLPI